MAIKYDGQDVKHLKYNDNYCKKVFKDGTCIWAETYGTLSKNYKTGLSNMVIERNKTYEPSANLGELNHNDILYYGDSIDLTFTPAEYYSVSPSSKTVSIDGTSPNEISYNTGYLYSISRSPRTITVQTPLISDPWQDVTTFRVGVEYTNTSGSVVTTLCSYGTTATTISDCWQGSTIKMYPRTTTSTSVIPYTAYICTYANYSAGSSTISQGISNDFNIYYPTACQHMYKISQTVYPTSSSYTYVCYSLSTNKLYTKLYMNDLIAKKSTNQLWVTGTLTVTYLDSFITPTTTSFTTIMYQQYDYGTKSDYEKTLVTSSDESVSIKGYQLSDGSLAVKVKSTIDLVKSISLYIQDVGIATTDMYNNISMPKWDELSIGDNFIYMFNSPTVDCPINVKNILFSGKPSKTSNKFLLRVEGNVIFNGTTHSLDKYLPFYLDNDKIYSVNLGTLTGISAIKSNNCKYTLVCNLYNQTWTDVIASEVFTNQN